MDEVPHLVKVQQEWAPRGLTLIGVTAASAAEASEFAAAHELNYALLADAEEDLAAFGVKLIWGSPTYLLDPQGLVVAKGLDASVERVQNEL